MAATVPVERATWTVAEAAAILGIAETTYREQAAAGKLPARRIGHLERGRLVVPKIQLDRYLAGDWPAGVAS